MKPKSTVQSVERAFDIIEYLLALKVPASTKDIAQGIGLHINTTGNLVRTLYHRGYLTQCQGAMWTLGPQCIAMSESSNSLLNLRRAALPILEDLAHETGDNAFLGVNQNCQLYCVSQVDGAGAVVVSGQQAWLEQMHSTAAGQILLAWGGDKLISSLQDDGGLERFANATITDFDKLKKKLRTIHSKGYALCIEESCNGVASIAVPVLSKDGYIIAALGQAFPSYYIDSKQIVQKDRVLVLKKAAERISESISMD